MTCPKTRSTTEDGRGLLPKYRCQEAADMCFIFQDTHLELQVWPRNFWTLVASCRTRGFAKLTQSSAECPKSPHSSSGETSPAGFGSRIIFRFRWKKKNPNSSQQLLELCAAGINIRGVENKKSSPVKINANKNQPENTCWVIHRQPLGALGGDGH